MSLYAQARKEAKNEEQNNLLIRKSQFTKTGQSVVYEICYKIGILQQDDKIPRQQLFKTQYPGNQDVLRFIDEIAIPESKPNNNSNNNNNNNNNNTSNSSRSKTKNKKEINDSLHKPRKQKQKIISPEEEEYKEVKGKFKNKVNYTKPTQFGNNLFVKWTIELFDYFDNIIVNKCLRQRSRASMTNQQTEELKSLSHKKFIINILEANVSEFRQKRNTLMFCTRSFNHYSLGLNKKITELVGNDIMEPLLDKYKKSNTKRNKNGANGFRQELLQILLNGYNKELNNYLSKYGTFNPTTLNLWRDEDYADNNNSVNNINNNKNNNNINVSNSPSVNTYRNEDESSQDLSMYDSARIRINSFSNENNFSNNNLSPHTTISRNTHDSDGSQCNSAICSTISYSSDPMNYTPNTAPTQYLPQLTASAIMGTSPMTMDSQYNNDQIPPSLSSISTLPSLPPAPTTTPVYTQNTVTNRNEQLVLSGMLPMRTRESVDNSINFIQNIPNLPNQNQPQQVQQVQQVQQFEQYEEYPQYIQNEQHHIQYKQNTEYNQNEEPQSTQFNNNENMNGNINDWSQYNYNGYETIPPSTTIMPAGSVMPAAPVTPAMSALATYGYNGVSSHSGDAGNTNNINNINNTTNLHNQNNEYNTPNNSINAASNNQFESQSYSPVRGGIHQNSLPRFSPIETAQNYNSNDINNYYTYNNQNNVNNVNNVNYVNNIANIPVDNNGAEWTTNAWNVSNVSNISNPSNTYDAVAQNLDVNFINNSNNNVNENNDNYNNNYYYDNTVPIEENNIIINTVDNQNNTTNNVNDNNSGGVNDNYNNSNINSVGMNNNDIQMIGASNGINQTIYENNSVNNVIENFDNQTSFTSNVFSSPFYK